MSRNLIVVGDGPDLAQLRAKAGPTVTFTGRIDDQAVADHYARCRALIVPGEEDFGLTSVEAQASGAPVVAYGKGGVTESVVNGATPQPTGVLYGEQTVENLIEAIKRCESMTFDPAALKANAARFGGQRFRREFAAEVDAL